MKVPGATVAETKAREAMRLNRRLKQLSSDEEDDAPVVKKKEVLLKSLVL